MIIKPFVEKQVNSSNEFKGQKNEKQAAYYIDFEYKNNENTMVFHDLRIEYNGRIAQIDHLVMSPAGIYVIENKYFSGVLSKDNSDNWRVKYEDKEISIPSPILQNERHISLLKELFENEDIMPKGLFGKRIIPNIHNVVMISEKTITQGDMPSNVIKIDSFSSYTKKIRRSYLTNPLKALVADILPNNTIKEIAENLLKFHKEKDILKKGFIEAYQQKKTSEQILIDLKTVRKKLSKNLNIEAYKIFTDATLVEISEKKPKNKEEMLKISGVGEIKFDKYGQQFLNIFN